MSSNYGLDPLQLAMYVIRPTLKRVRLGSVIADALVLGTALQESHARFVDQLTPGPGPAYGLWQMEAATHTDHWNNFIRYKASLRDALLDIAGYDDLPRPPVHELVGNLFYGAAMCRVHYWRVKPPLPTDAEGLARYWKDHYNTALGRGTVQQALPHFAFALQIVQKVGAYP